MFLLNVINYNINKFRIQYCFGGFCCFKLSFFEVFWYKLKLWQRVLLYVAAIIDRQSKRLQKRFDLTQTICWLPYHFIPQKLCVRFGFTTKTIGVHWTPLQAIHRFHQIKNLCSNKLFQQGGGRKTTPTIKQLIAYKQKRSGDNVLHFANCLPDLNFTFSIFNFQFKKLQL